MRLRLAGQALCLASSVFATADLRLPKALPGPRVYTPKCNATSSERKVSAFSRQGETLRYTCEVTLYGRTCEIFGGFKPST